MTEILTRLRDMLLDHKETNIPEIKFLQESDIILTLNRGFTELYRAKPENPVLYLSKWLTRESRAIELAKKYKDNQIKRDKLQIKYHQQEKIKYIVGQRNEEKKKVRKDDEDSLIKEIKNCKDFWLGFNHICERLKVLVKATGCYVGVYDPKRRPVTEDDDENGHLHPSGVKVLRYIGWNDDHHFLDGKCLEPNQGVTYDLINPKPAQPGATEGGDNNQGGANQADPNKAAKEGGDGKAEEVKEIKLEDTVKTLLIDDVVNDNRIYFFKEPRLGCYLALDLTYKSSLSYNSLVSAIQCTKDYEAAKEEQEKRLEEWREQQEQIKAQINEHKDAKAKEEEAKKLAEEKALEAEAKAKLAAAAENADPNKPPEEKKEAPAQQQQQQNVSQANISRGKDASMDHSESIEALEKQLKENEWKEEAVKLKDYEKEEKNVYMCLDTLGQDRVFNDEELKLIKIVGANIRDSLEKLEQSLLEKDRDIRISFLQLETKIKAEERFSDEKFEECINNYISQYYGSEEYKSKGITDEEAKTFEGDLARMRYLKNLILEGDCLTTLMTFQEFEFVEFAKLFQNLFYFAKINPLDINELKTNKLEWKRARTIWKQFFPYATEYSPLGPKPEEVKPIYKLNKIKENLEAVLAKRDDVKAYSQTLLLLADLILHIIRVRHDDIIERKCKKAVLKDKREQIIKNNSEIDEERQKIIAAAKELNPNVKVPGENQVKEGENGEKKEDEENNKESKEEKDNKDAKENKEEGAEKKEENKEQPPEQQNPKPEENAGEQGEAKEGEQKSAESPENNKDEIDSAKLAEDLQNFDKEHPKQEVPPDVEYDIDNDYDIDKAEMDTFINNALQAANNNNPQDKDKKPVAAANPVNQSVNPVAAGAPKQNQPA